MLPKIPQLKRENASLRHPREEDPPTPINPSLQEKVDPRPQQKAPQKVWWDVEKADPQRHVDKEA